MVLLANCFSVVGALHQLGGYTGCYVRSSAVTTTLQALVSDAGGKLRLAGFEALVTPTPF